MEELLPNGELHVRYPNNSLLPVSPQGANKVSAVSHMKAIESHVLVKVQCKRKWQVNSTAIHVVSLLCTVNLNSGVG